MAGNEIIALGLLLMVGFAGGKLTSWIRLPSVTGYIVAGLVMGPSLLGLVSASSIERLDFINSVALSFIALSVGGKLNLKELKEDAWPILSISFFQTVAVGAITFVSLFALGVHPVIAFLLSSTALATAPAAVMAVVEETRSSGRFTNTLLAVVALSNLLAVIVFGFALSAAPMLNANTGLSFTLMKIPMAVLGGSLLMGGFIGVVLAYIAPRARGPEELLIIILGTAFLSSELARTTLHFSPLLINIIIGMVLVNLCQVSARLFDALERIELPLFVTFFSLQGAHLDITVLEGIGLVGLVYVLSRAAGKVIGAMTGAYLSRASDDDIKYMGPSLFPQAGIAVGMIAAVQLEPSFSAYSDMVTTIVLSAVLINELVGPVILKIALEKTGETG